MRLKNRIQLHNDTSSNANKKTNQMMDAVINWVSISGTFSSLALTMLSQYRYTPTQLHKRQAAENPHAKIRFELFLLIWVLAA
jgi:hypothetical protein